MSPIKAIGLILTRQSGAGDAPSHLAPATPNERTTAERWESSGLPSVMTADEGVESAGSILWVSPLRSLGAASCWLSLWADDF
jgi:hypothetical protein